jgi:hypothetical protein
MKSSSNAGPRGPCRKEFWLSGTGMPCAVVITGCRPPACSWRSPPFPKLALLALDLGSVIDGLAGRFVVIFFLLVATAEVLSIRDPRACTDACESHADIALVAGSITDSAKPGSAPGNLFHRSERLNRKIPGRDCRQRASLTDDELGRQGPTSSLTPAVLATS